MSEKLILDVREIDEYTAVHVPGSVHCALSDFASQAPQAIAACAGKDVLILCRSGMRAKLALEELKKLGLHDRARFTVYEGGILAWQQAGQPVVMRKRAHFPIMRQVQAIAGGLALASGLAALFVNPAFAWGAVAIGVGLSVAGWTGYCAMAKLLAFAPWNRTE